jgi:hypothetical protein
MPRNDQWRTYIVKLNVNTSFDEATLSGPTGAIVRDPKGFLIGASNHLIVHAQGVIDAMNRELIL